MREVSIGFLEEIVKPSRTVDAKIVINGYTITSNDIVSYEITSSLTDNDMPTIGSAVASSVKFEVTKSSLPMIYVGQKLEFYAGLLVNGTMEWVRVGTFKTTAEYVNKKKLTVEIEAFDEMFWLGNTIYESDLSYPATVASMMSELVTKYGLVFSSDMYAFEERRTHESMEAFTYGQLEAYWYQPRITDDIVFHIDPTQQEYSIRSILSQMALLTSSNVVIDSFGEIVFRFLRPTDFEITGENYVDYTRLSEGNIYISQLISKNPELEQTFVSGVNTGVAITVENSGIVSQVQNDDIRNRVYPLTYTPYSMTCQGMPHLEIGDTVRFVEVDDTESVLFIVNYSFEYNGGFRNKFTVKSPEKDNVETTPFRSASSTVSGETIRLTNQTLEQAIANASELITGNQGGHVVTVRDEVTGKPQEILILVDSDDVNTATKLWRWNAGGLGFSNTGYNGTYELAMTSDGNIVADAINASELSAIVANLGTVTAGRIEDGSGVNYWDLNTGDMNLNEIKIAGKKVSASLTEIDGNLNTLELTATSLTNRISNAEGDVSTLQNTAQGLTNRVSNAEGDIFALETTATSLQSQITTNNGNISTLNQTATSLSSRIGTAEGNISTLNQTAQGLALDIAATDGRALNAQATADAVTLNFKTSGARNLLKNGNAESGVNNWNRYTHTGSSYHIGIRNDLWVAYLNTHEIRSVGSNGSFAEAFTTIYELIPGKKYTVTMRLAGHNALNMFYMVNQAGDSIIGGYSEVADDVHGGHYADWVIIKHTFTASDPTMTIRLRCTNKTAGTAYLWAKEMRINEGTESMAYMPYSNAVYGLSHVLDGSGYTMRDSNGLEIMSLSKGVANEQNIGRADNTQLGYALKLPFHIGSEVSQITQAILKWDISKFRTYSEGAASGGGVMTTPSGGGSTSGSGGSSTVSVKDWKQGLAASTSNATVTSSNLGQPHYHTTSTANLAHRHDIPSHTHSTPAHSHSVDITHSHDPVFGILETNVVSNYMEIYVDGVQRGVVNAQRGEIDLSAWVTTSGWHVISLSSDSLKRIDANLFLKTYIRR